MPRSGWSVALRSRPPLTWPHRQPIQRPPIRWPCYWRGTPRRAVVALAMLLAAGLGAAHALSPGHGKTLVAAYLVGSGGTMRRPWPGLTVAFAHTAGVLLLGILVLVPGELLLPETLIGWLTIASGALMTVLEPDWCGGRSPAVAAGAMGMITAIRIRMGGEVPSTLRHPIEAGWACATWRFSASPAAWCRAPPRLDRAAGGGGRAAWHSGWP